MSEETIKTGKYDNFDKGASTVSKFNDTIETEKQNIIKMREALINEGVFMGPIAESCGGGFTSANKLLSGQMENFDVVGSYLTKCKDNYLNADDKSKDLYLSIKKNGKLQVTEGLAYSAYVNKNCAKYQSDFINQILPYAIQLYNEKGILPSLTIGQACKESAFGTARPGSGYNVFGIKASGWKGKTANARTGEQTKSGSTYYINANFRDYDTLEAAVHDYGEVLSLDRYAKVRSAKNYKEAAHAVKAGGYATGVNYDNSLIHDYIEAYHLNQWDP